MNRRCSFLVLLVIGLPSLAADAADAEQYRLLLAFRDPADPGTKGCVMKGTSEIRYSLQRRETKVDIILHRIRLDIEKDGKPNMSSLMSKKRFRNMEEGKEGADLQYDDAPPALKEILDVFDNSICTYEVDRWGKEIGRTLSTAKGAKAFVHRGMIGNLRLFHVMFPGDSNEWEVKQEIGVDSNNSATGVLRYQKGKSGAGEKGVPVHVSGQLSSGLMKRTNNPDEAFRATYDVTGTQTFDPELKVWIGGELKMTIEHEYLLKGKVQEKRTSETRVTLRRLSEK
jgi:hypothetical protein